MKVAFVTDDRTGYLQGTYYQTYLEGFKRIAGADIFLIFEPGYKSSDLNKLEDLVSYDVILLGHGCVDRLISGPKSYFPVSSIDRLERCRRRAVSIIRKCHGFKIVLSKNDYKNVIVKRKLFDAISADLIVTHTRRALRNFESPSWDSIWLPFATDPLIRRFQSESSAFDVGFRSNDNPKWNNGLRENLFFALNDLPSRYSRSLNLSANGENFLHGEAYFDWLSGCSLLANTESAMGTVGPQFAESFALGVVPLATVGFYEGILEPNRHYLAVSVSLDDLQAQISRFIASPLMREELQGYGFDFYGKFNVDNQVRVIFERLE